MLRGRLKLSKNNKIIKVKSKSNVKLRFMFKLLVAKNVRRLIKK